MVRFYLDDQEVNSPTDWEGFSVEFTRDFDKRIISVKFSDTVTFSGQAYAYLLNVYESEGYCKEVAYQITEDCGGGQVLTAARGTIILADAEWNETTCHVQVSIADNGIGARVANNMKVPISPVADRTKNSDGVTPVNPVALTMFKDDGTDIVGTRLSYDWWDCIVQGLAYITDGSVQVVSDWYANLPDDEHFAVAVGSELRTSGYTMPRLSYTFDDLFMELAKKYNLWIFATEMIDGTPQLRIEPEAYFYGPATGTEYTDIQDLVRKVDTARMYATVKIGSKDSIKELQTANPLPFVVLLGFTEESFHFTGICNTEAELDLTNKWVIDTNVIYQVVEQNNDEYDDDYFLIQYTASTGKATQGTYLFQGDVPYLYNEQLLNSNVLLRYPLPSSVGTYYGIDFNDSFRAEYTMIQSGDVTSWRMDTAQPDGTTDTYYHAPFDDDYTPDNFDTSNVWGNGTAPGTPVTIANSRFTASGQGVYVFAVRVRWGVSSTYPTPVLVPGPGVHGLSMYPGVGVRVEMKMYSSGGIQIGTGQIQSTPVRFLVGNQENVLTFTVSLSPGEYVEFWKAGYKSGQATNTYLGAAYGPSAGAGSTVGTVVNMNYSGPDGGSTVETSKVASGGFIIPATPSRVLVFAFDRATTLQEWIRMTTIPQDGIMIDGQRLTHALNLKRDLKGATSFETVKTP